MSKGKGHPLTEDEKNYIIQNVETMQVKDIAKQLGRSIQAVNNNIRRLMDKGRIDKRYKPFIPLEVNPDIQAIAEKEYTDELEYSNMEAISDRAGIRLNVPCKIRGIHGTFITDYPDKVLFKSVYGVREMFNKVDFVTEDVTVEYM